jgi:molybdate transport system substrate-binding protein
MHRFLFPLIIAALVLAGCKPAADKPTPGKKLAIAAAADLKFALEELVKDYRAAHADTEINVTYGSSGNFFAQLQNKAPFDLYFSADIDYPRKLAEAGHALDKDVFLYAVGRIVVWVPKTSAIDVEKLGIAALADRSVKKIAVANPQHAPYGRAAVAALKSLNAYAQAEPRLVYGENIAQTAQFVQSGSADIGVIALSLAVAPQMKDAGRYWEIPLDAYPTMEQGGIILDWATDAAGARSFRDHVLGEKGRALLKRYGFFLPAK